METDQILRMKEGTGEHSYAKNSKPQNVVITWSKSAVEEAVVGICCDTLLEDTITIADLGCATGPNTLATISVIMTAFYRQYREVGQPPPEFQVFLNDLPGNDFNTVFKSLPAFHENLQKEYGQASGPCFISGVPGSFYGRLFPSRSLHFVHSSASLHWLSRVPPELTESSDNSPLVVNRGKIYISKTSPPAVVKAYATQFQRDFSSFLRARSEELAPGGRMVLSFRGRKTSDPLSDESCFLWDVLGQAIHDLVSKGLVSENMLDSYNAPYYDACTEEVMEEIKKEGSFTIDRLEKKVMPWNSITGQTNCDRETICRRLTSALRAIQEPILEAHFGVKIMDSLFNRVGELINASNQEICHVLIAVSLTRS